MNLEPNKPEENDPKLEKEELSEDTLKSFIKNYNEWMGGVLLTDEEAEKVRKEIFHHPV